MGTGMCGKRKSTWKRFFATAAAGAATTAQDIAPATTPLDAECRSIFMYSPGALEMEELPKILAEFDVEYDEKRLPDMFNIYDVDR